MVRKGEGDPWKSLMAAILLQAFRDIGSQNFEKALDGLLWLIYGDGWIYTEVLNLPDPPILLAIGWMKLTKLLGGIGNDDQRY